MNRSVNKQCTKKFNDQLDHIARAWTPNTIILGDFNLDWAKRHCQNYALKNFFNDMDDRIGHLNLIQIVEFVTWARTINGAIKDSMLTRKVCFEVCGRFKHFEVFEKNISIWVFQKLKHSNV